MMKRVSTMLMVLGLLMGGVQQVSAQGGWGAAMKGAVNNLSGAVEKSGVVEKTKSLVDSLGQSGESSELSPVARALNEAGYFTQTKAKPDAEYYIFICSASWCPPCRALMPKIAAEYKKMVQDKRVSLILLGGDRTEEACKKYLRHYQCDMPGILGSKTINLPNRPKTPYVPFAFIMNADGELITSGHGSIVLDWEKHIQQK